MKLSSLLSLFWLSSLHCGAVDDSLVFVHALFRHGDRTPEKNNLYRTSPYYNESFFKPYGNGQLTNKGKLTVYNVGKALRQRYDGFLDESYNINLIDARSSDFNRTKASLQVMLAGLFPPTKDLIWLEDLNWQPIPYTYAVRSLDKELFCFGCANWNPNFDGYLESKDGKSLVDQYESLYQYITEKTGEDYSQLTKVYYLYFGFEILEQFNYTLPDWAPSIYPHPLKDIATMYYRVMVATSKLRQMAAGYLLKKILSDTQVKMDGKIPEKKMSIWCGHESNIAALLKIMNVWNDDEIASYGSFILMELHYLDQKHGFKIFYHNNKESEPKLLKIPGCEEFCPLDDFISLVKEDIPENDGICGTVSMGPNRWIVMSVSLVALMKLLV
ncbi:hypothetical protein JTB14_002571 [Gonioctena quinquepunctata]|nr:hypothetical protein JTB14_002571 [Gonioctena quinquepunctata]